HLGPVREPVDLHLGDYSVDERAGDDAAGRGAEVDGEGGCGHVLGTPGRGMDVVPLVTEVSTRTPGVLLDQRGGSAGRPTRPTVCPAGRVAGEERAGVSRPPVREVSTRTRGVLLDQRFVPLTVSRRADRRWRRRGSRRPRGRRCRSPSSSWDGRSAPWTR